jgi:hypothetical protein
VVDTTKSYLQDISTDLATQNKEHQKSARKITENAFTSYEQSAIFDKLGKKDRDIALQFLNHNQFLAFEELSQRTDTTPEENAQSALKFKEFSQVEALKILGDEDLALKFHSPLSLDVLKKIGKNNVELVLNFKHYVQYEALKLIIPTLALQITTYPQLHTLTQLGNHCFQEALKAKTGDLAEINFLSEICTTRLAENDLKITGESSDTSEQDL